MRADSQYPALVPVVQVQRRPQLVRPPDVLHQAEEDDQQLLDAQLAVVLGHGVLQHRHGQRDGNLTEEILLHLDLYLSLAEHGQAELVADLHPTPGWEDSVQEPVGAQLDEAGHPPALSVLPRHLTDKQ